MHRLRLAGAALTQGTLLLPGPGSRRVERGAKPGSQRPAPAAGPQLGVLCPGLGAGPGLLL